MSNSKFFKGSIIITDPSYFISNDEDWKKCNYGDELTVLGFTDYLFLEFPDDPQVVKNMSTNEKIGGLCQDSGCLVVVYKQELEKYNPDYKKSIGSDENYTMVKDFEGEISSMIVPYGKDDFDTIISGKGSINFKSCYEDDQKDTMFDEAFQSKVASILAKIINKTV